MNEAVISSVGLLVLQFISLSAGTDSIATSGFRSSEYVNSIHNFNLFKLDKCKNPFLFYLYTRWHT